MDFKNINIGEQIRLRVNELGIDIDRICNFLKVEKSEVMDMYTKKEMSTYFLLRWSKLLKYDFFRLYSQHLILYAPACNLNNSPSAKGTSKLPIFRKSIYTQQVIDFILEQISSGKKTKLDIINEYKIPKTTLYKWISKNIYNRTDE